MKSASANQTNCTLSITDLQLFLHLGCSEEEKKNRQSVAISLTFNFLTPPLAMESDELKDTICYGAVAAAIEESTHNRRFNTIEYLADTLFSTISSRFLSHQKEIVLTVTVHKITPPIATLHGGATFSYTAPLKAKE